MPPTGFIPQQDKGYLLLNVQLPDSASVERTRWAMGRIEEIARKTPGRRAHRRHLGPVADPERERPEPGLDVRHAQGFLRTSRPGHDGRRHRRRAPRELSPGGPGGGGRRVRAAADRRPGDHRRPQDDHRGPRQPRPGSLQKVSDQIVAPGEQDLGPPGLLQQLPDRHALALPRHRPDQVHGARRLGERRLQHAAVLPGLVLRQQLQRVRPDLAGQHPGRRSLPRRRQRHQETPGAEQQRPDDPARHGPLREQHQRAGLGDAVQHVLRHRRHRQHLARAPAPARRSP